MSKIKTVCTATITDHYMKELEKYCDITLGGWIVTGDFLAQEQLIELFQGAELLIVEYEEVTEHIIASLPDLKLIVCPRGTPVNIDCEAAARRGIPVVNTPGRNANSVAEFVVSSMISIARQISCADHEVKNGRYLGPVVEDIYTPSDQDDVVWSLEEEDSPFKRYKGFEITGRIMGFIGFGAIGARTAELLEKFEMEYLAYDPYCPPALAEKYGVKLVSMEEVFRRSDFVSVHCKVTEETKNMIGREQFRWMRRDAYFINTARGTVVRQKDLIEALEKEEIAGAVLDVFWREPLPENHPLLRMRNVQITPHIAGASYDVPACHSRMVLQDIQHYINNEPLERVYNRRLLT